MKALLMAMTMLLSLAMGCAHKEPKPWPPPVMDLHSDILLRAIDNGVDIGNAPEWTQVNTRTMKLGNVKDQVFAVWVDSGLVRGEAATTRANQMIDLYEGQAQKYASDFALATTVAESDEIEKSGRIATWLWIEGGAPINNDLELLRHFHKRGIRGMTLTWTNNLLWAGSSSDKQDSSKGLNDFGKDVVREMNRLGMVVDVSHVSEATLFDAIAESKDPVIASHSGCRALCKHDRNLTDDELRAIAKNGGVACMSVFPQFLKDGWEAGWDAAEKASEKELEALKAEFNGDTRSPEFREKRRLILQAHLAPESVVTVEDYVDHIDHAVKIAGIEHVGLGSDFDGIRTFAVGIEKASKWPNVAEALRRRGYSDDDIRLIFRDNARRVFRQVIDE